MCPRAADADPATRPVGSFVPTPLVVDPAATATFPAAVDSEGVADLALSIGEAQLAAGASAAEVTATIEAVLVAYGLYDNVVDVTYTSITIAHRPHDGARSQILVRVVRHRSQDYSRLVGVDQILEDIRAGALSVRAAQDALHLIVHAEHPYRRYVAIGAWGTMSASVAVMFGAGPYAAGGAFFSACLIYLSGLYVYRKKLPPFLGQMLGATIAVGVAVALKLTGVPARPSLVVVSGIVVLLAGMTFVGAVTDALTGYYVTASARLLEVALLTGGVIAGVSFGLQAAERLGLDFNASPAMTTVTHLPVTLAAAGATAAAYAYASYAPKRCLLPVAMIAALGQMVAFWMDKGGFGGPWGAGVAALVVGCAAYTFEPVTRTPGLVIVGAGVIPLLPGLSIYRGLYDLTGAANLHGVITLGAAVTLGAAIAAGALIGERLSHPLLRLAGRAAPDWSRAR